MKISGYSLMAILDILRSRRKFLAEKLGQEKTYLKSEGMPSIVNTIDALRNVDSKVCATQALIALVNATVAGDVQGRVRTLSWAIHKVGSLRKHIDEIKGLSPAKKSDAYAYYDRVQGRDATKEYPVSTLTAVDVQTMVEELEAEEKAVRAAIRHMNSIEIGLPQGAELPKLD